MLRHLDHVGMIYSVKFWEMMYTMKHELTSHAKLLKCSTQNLLIK